MSPSGIFVGYDQADLDDLKATFKAQLTGGQRTSISGGGKSGTKAYPFSPQQGLLEIRYAEQQNGTLPPRATPVVQVLNCGYRRVGTIVTP